MSNFLEVDKQIIRDAMKYRDGEDSCNSFYMGSIATAGMYHIVGIRYKDSGFEEALIKADRPIVDKLLKRAASYIKYMNEHPIKRCKNCNQIMSCR